MVSKWRSIRLIFLMSNRLLFENDIVIVYIDGKGVESVDIAGGIAAL